MKEAVTEMLVVQLKLHSGWRWSCRSGDGYLTLSIDGGSTSRFNQKRELGNGMEYGLTSQNLYFKLRYWEWIRFHR